MPNKSLSEIILPDSLLKAYSPATSAAWEIGCAGWATALCLFVAGSLIADLSNGFKAGIAECFSNLVVIFVGGAATLVVMTAVARLRRGGPSTLSATMMVSAFVLLSVLGALAIVLGVLGIFVALTLNGASYIFSNLVQHADGVLLGVALIVWAVGEVAELGRAPGGDRAQSAVKSLVPQQLVSRSEVGSSWELSLAGFILAMWLYWISAYIDGAVPDLAVAMYLFAVGGPVAVAAITLVARLRGPGGSDLARWSLDIALLLTLGIAPLLVVYAVVDFFKAFNLNGFGNVLGFLLATVVGSLVAAVLIAIWALGEIGALRRLVPAAGGTLRFSVQPAEPLKGPVPDEGPRPEEPPKL